MKLLYGFKTTINNYNVNLLDAECRDILMSIVKNKSAGINISAEQIAEQYLTLPFKYEFLLAYTLATVSDNPAHFRNHFEMCSMLDTYNFFNADIINIWTLQKNSYIGLYGILKDLFKGRLVNIYNQNFINKCVIETELDGV